MEGARVRKVRSHDCSDEAGASKQACAENEKHARRVHESVELTG